MSDTDALNVEFCGEQQIVGPEQTLSFGRVADLVVDDNEFLHGVVGRFERRHERWWITNEGSRTVLDVYDRLSRSRATLMPGTDQALPGADVVVRFSAGRAVYEIEASTGGEAPSPQSKSGSGDTLDGHAPQIEFTDGQRLLVLALAERSLRQPHLPVEVPTSREAAHRLGWPMTTFNRKLDVVCRKVAKLGLPGLAASGTEPAKNRRVRLVEHALNSRLVGAAELELLDQHMAEQRS